MSRDAAITSITGAGSLLGRDGHLLELGAARLIAGEATGAVAAEAQAHLAECVVCTTYLDQLRSDDVHVRSSLPPLPAFASTAWRHDKLDRRRSAQAIATVGAVLACAAALLLWIRAKSSDESTGVRSKGKPVVLVVHAHDGTSQRPVGPHDRVRAGERIGFEVAAPAGGYLMIVGVDSAGTTYPCYPQDSQRAVQVEPIAALTALPAAVELDDVLGRERIVAIVCDRMFTLQDASARVASKQVQEGCSLAEVTLIKEAR